jgi:hypothetical protein
VLESVRCKQSGLSRDVVGGPSLDVHLLTMVGHLSEMAVLFAGGLVKFLDLAAYRAVTTTFFNQAQRRNYHSEPTSREAQKGLITGLSFELDAGYPEVASSPGCNAI